MLCFVTAGKLLSGLGKRVTLGNSTDVVGESTKSVQTFAKNNRGTAGVTGKPAFCMAINPCERVR